MIRNKWNRLLFNIADGSLQKSLNFEKTKFPLPRKCCNLCYKKQMHNLRANRIYNVYQSYLKIDARNYSSQAKLSFTNLENQSKNEYQPPQYEESPVIFLNFHKAMFLNNVKKLKSKEDGEILKNSSNLKLSSSKSARYHDYPTDPLTQGSSASFVFDQDLIEKNNEILREYQKWKSKRRSKFDAKNFNQIRFGSNPEPLQMEKLPTYYASLAKSRLTGLVVASAVGGYMMAPGPLGVATLFGSCVGTGLVSAAANTTNQIIEVEYDSMMKRTANRVLVRDLLSSTHAAGFAVVCGTVGLATLHGFCGPTAALLGAFNIFLYTAVYTPSKRLSILNTWIGAVVGAVPPLIGWVACGGVLIGSQCWGAWLMAGLLFAWQFPHFNALSWNIKNDYTKAGYRMMAHYNPRLCKVTCIRYSALMVSLGLVAPLLDVTTWTFAVHSAPFNLAMLFYSYRFYRDGDSKSSRDLFKLSLIHLPAIMVLMILSKKHNNEKTKPNAEPVIAAFRTLIQTPEEMPALPVKPQEMLHEIETMPNLALASQENLSAISPASS